MEYITLSNGVAMPMLGYGCFLVSPEECERCVTDAIDVGYRAIDTAVPSAKQLPQARSGGRTCFLLRKCGS